MESAIASIIAKGTPSGWTLCVIGLAGLILLGKIVAGQRPKMRELEMTEGDSLRAAFVAEMTALRAEIKDLRDENTALRSEIRGLHATIDGMRREAMQAGVSTQRAVVDALPPGFVPPRTQEALDRIKGVGE